MEREICTCCYLRAAPERFSPTDKRPQICVACAKHLRDAERRDREHVRDWRAAQRGTVQSYESRLTNMRTLLDAADHEKTELRAALSDAISTISSEYHKAPIGDLRNALETELVAQERGRAQSAFRIRSRAMVVIWRVDQVHNTVDAKQDGHCKCGDRADKCSVLAALNPFTEELDKWEAQEKERMTAGRDHGLPAEHPASRKYMQKLGALWRGPGRYEESWARPGSYRR